MLDPGPRRRPIGLISASLSLPALLFLALLVQNMAPAAGSAGGPGADRLFNLTRIWRVNLHFEPEQWEALEPSRGAGPFGAPGGPGGPSGPRDGGPATFVAAAFLGQGDSDGDGRLTREEFRALAQKWFAAWDTKRAWRLDADALRSGLDATIAPAGGMGPGGPGGPGGRGPGMGLQAAEGGRNGLAGAPGASTSGTCRRTSNSRTGGSRTSGSATRATTRSWSRAVRSSAR